jgi:hypothetical protein
MGGLNCSNLPRDTTEKNCYLFSNNVTLRKKLPSIMKTQKCPESSGKLRNDVDLIVGVPTETIKRKNYLSDTKARQHYEVTDCKAISDCCRKRDQ